MVINLLAVTGETLNKMSNQYEQNEVWIGLAKVKQFERNGVLGDADQAYVNVL